MQKIPATRARGGARVKVLGGVAAGGAVAVLAMFSAWYGGNGSSTVPLAGSGDAPTNTTYVQPAVSGMTEGVTEIATTPPSAPAISMASPTVKAGK